MKKILIDLNIIIDFLNKRDDHEAALAVYDKCVKRKVKGYVSSHEITTLSYFLEKEKYERVKRNKIISNLLDNISVLTAHEEILRKSLISELEDYEDAVIDELAINEGIDYIVTRNLKDFKRSRNKIYTAREILDVV
ncbi:MAG: PIN domain-containing protein [Bacteroidales bacterium]|nr:PIN domain-containing protein [Bacteroidales bacterium]MBI9056104.1 PIN domain-containing protein [Bacteroidales bacterium]